MYELKKVVAKVPKVIRMKNSHYLGAWSRNLIISLVVCFVTMAGLVGTA